MFSLSFLNVCMYKKTNFYNNYIYSFLSPLLLMGHSSYSQSNIVTNLNMLCENNIINVANTFILILLLGRTAPQLASHVLQFIYLSDSGFRFPSVQFPSGGYTPSDLYFNFWEGVLKMQEYGFV